MASFAQALHEAIPDPEVVCSLEPEELAGAILPVLVRETSGAFNPRNLMEEVMAHSQRAGEKSYPKRHIAEIKVALQEAFEWLRAQVLILPDYGNSEGWMSLSRRARRIRGGEDFSRFSVSRYLNRELLHPAIADRVCASFVRGELDAAVFHAMRAVEIAVREAAGFPESLHGTIMMRKAFDKNAGPLRDPNQEEAEREALAHLFAGAVGFYKNPHSHRNVSISSAREAIGIVMFGSHLLHIVDARTPPKGSGAG